MMLSYLKGLDVSLTFLLISILTIGAWLWNAHKNPSIDFDFFDLILEDGKISRTAAVFMGSFCMTTWMMVRLTIDQHMTEGYFTTYSATWIVPIIAKLFRPQPVPSTTTTSTTSVKTIEIPIEEVKT